MAQPMESQKRSELLYSSYLAVVAVSGRRSAGVDDLVAVVKNSLCKSRSNHVAHNGRHEVFQLA